ncbi:hypothetical protein [Streptomyces sp. NPDC096013]|uniref:hypothetical protein n=1 Tax=Streptomyces sp. NPDC096013 TaxID=3366069 RepID=UPI0037FF4E69
MAEQEARQVLPEVQEYIERLDAADKAHSAALNAANEKYPQRYADGDEAQRQRAGFHTEVTASYQALTDAYNAAWEALRNSGDPLVKWIADNCANYSADARVILTALPATLGQLDALAEDEGWCPVWDSFRQQAIDAGVAPSAKAPGAAVDVAA